LTLPELLGGGEEKERESVQLLPTSEGKKREKGAPPAGYLVEEGKSTEYRVQKKKKKKKSFLWSVPHPCCCIRVTEGKKKGGGGKWLLCRA